jgi:oligopeptide transport system substrate-binding protein
LRARPALRATTFFTLAALLLAACGRFSSDASGRALGGSIVAGLSEIGSLNPADATSASALTLLRTACDGLVGLDFRTGEPKPALATSWNLSEGARKLTVTLRSGARFHDGTPVTPEAVREALSRVARPSSASPWASLVARVDGFAEVQAGAATHLSGIRAEETGLTITLREPFSDFATVLAHPALIPVSLESLRNTPNGSDLPVCSGPYRIERGGDGQDLRLGKGSGGFNEGYRNRGRGEAELILIRSFESNEDAYQAYRNGQVDIAPVPGSRVGEAEQRAGYHSEPTPQITFLGFNPASAETSDPRLRQAMSLAIDRLVIIDAAFGDARQPASGWLPAGTTPPDASSCGSFVRRIADPAKAKLLLGSTNIRPDDFKLSVYYDASATPRLVVDALELQIEEVLEIDVQPTELQGQELASHVVNKPAGASAWLMSTTIHLPVLDEFIGTPFRTGSVANVLGFSDSQFDKRVDEARSAGSQPGKVKGYSQAESQLCSLMPAIPLWSGVSRWMFNPERVDIGGDAYLDWLGSPLLRHARAAG